MLRDALTNVFRAGSNNEDTIDADMVSLSLQEIAPMGLGIVNVAMRIGEDLRFQMDGGPNDVG